MRSKTPCSASLLITKSMSYLNLYLLQVLKLYTSVTYLSEVGFEPKLTEVDYDLNSAP
jgi:hypothetical protein